MRREEVGGYTTNQNLRLRVSGHIFSRKDNKMKQTDIAPAIARELSVQPWQVEKTVALLDEGNTVPFIAR